MSNKHNIYTSIPNLMYSSSLSFQHNTHTYHPKGVERVIFVGNYLCGNELSVQMLAYAMEFWSQGTIRAIFLEHEGYFGALGSMLFRLDPDVQQ